MGSCLDRACLPPAFKGKLPVFLNQPVPYYNRSHPATLAQEQLLLQDPPHFLWSYFGFSLNCIISISVEIRDHFSCL